MLYSLPPELLPAILAFLEQDYASLCPLAAVSRPMHALVWRERRLVVSSAVCHQQPPRMGPRTAEVRLVLPPGACAAALLDRLPASVTAVHVRRRRAQAAGGLFAGPVTTPSPPRRRRGRRSVLSGGPTRAAAAAATPPSVRRAPHVSPAAVAHLLSSCRALSSLMLNTRAITDAGLRRLARGCKRLESLRLWGGGFTGDDAVSALAAGCPDLRELNAASCAALSALGVRRLAAGLPGLRRLSLEGSRVSDEDAGRVAAACPALESLVLVMAAAPALAGAGEAWRRLRRLEIVAASDEEAGALERFVERGGGAVREVRIV